MEKNTGGIQELNEWGESADTTPEEAEGEQVGEVL